MTDRIEMGPLPEDDQGHVTVTGPEKRGEPLNPPLDQDWRYPPKQPEPAQELVVPQQQQGMREVDYFATKPEDPSSHGLLRRPRTPLDVRREALDNAQVGMDSTVAALKVALDWLAIDDPAAADEWERRLLPEVELCVEGVTRRRKALEA